MIHKVVIVSEIAKSAIETPELSNRLLRPLQLLKADLETETSIANIYMLQTQTAGADKPWHSRRARPVAGP